MRVFVKKEDTNEMVPIIGVLERLSAIAQIHGINPEDGTLEYIGESDLDWDSQQEAMLPPYADRVFVSREGLHYLEAELWVQAENGSYLPIVREQSQRQKGLVKQAELLSDAILRLLSRCRRRLTDVSYEAILKGTISHLVMSWIHGDHGPEATAALARSLSKDPEEAEIILQMMRDALK